ncbi:ATP-dependent RNA helicase-like protein DB10 [Salvia divinorum]|uniref:ATP-dependent RNA helicase-like protein DB10 n=1 Tax=Salvia divinorum TaxID=28513 RepID=A0ABD1FKE0_SALDI
MRPVASPVVCAVVDSDALGSSAQKDSQCRGYHDEGGNNNAGSVKSPSDPGADQSAQNRSDHTPSDQNVAKSEVHKPVESKGAETGLSVEAYCRRHEITVTVSILLSCLCNIFNLSSFSASSLLK